MQKLGERLRREELPARADIEMLLTLISEYEPAMQHVQEILRDEFGLESVARSKNYQTLIEKLRRDRSRLHSIHDVAGVRVSVDCNLDEQLELGNRIQARFEGAISIDRRLVPNHGYRAFHVVASLDGFYVEVQVRTRLQNLWANVNEKIGDVYGREHRYGIEPSITDPLARHAYNEMRGLITKASSMISEFEELEVRVTRTQRDLEFSSSMDADERALRREELNEIYEELSNSKVAYEKALMDLLAALESMPQTGGQ